MANNTLYLLTGAAGFLGSNICSQLLERGDKVRAFVLNGDPAVKYIPEGVEIFTGNLCSADDCQKFFDVPEGTETICIHCASMVTTNPDYSEKLIAVNVGGTENILAGAKSHPSCKKLVYVSSTGAIPEAPKGQAITEVDTFVPYEDDRVVGWYSRSKAMATQKVLDAANKDGLNACVVHPSGILGPNDHAISETTGTIIKIMKGEMSVGMGGSFNLCDVRDLAAGTIGAADKGRKGECYILGNKEVTLKEVCKMLHDASGCKQPIFYVPINMAYMLAAQMERKAKKTGEKPLMTNFAVYNLARNNNFDYSKAERELGYHTRSYAETLTDEANWLVAEGYVPAFKKPETPAQTTVSDAAAEAASEENLKEVMEDSNLIQKVAAADSEETLKAVLAEEKITEFSGETLQNAYKALELSRSFDHLEEIFGTGSYAETRKKLTSMGIGVTPAEYDLIKDIFATANDTDMSEDMNLANDVAPAVEVLEAHGHYHITEEFVLSMLDYVNVISEAHVFTDAEYAEMDQMTFSERVEKYINRLCAISVIAGMKFGLEGTFGPAYMIALAGAMNMVRARL